MVSFYPMKNGAERDERGEGSSELIVTCRNAPMTFERAEEVFDVMPVPIEPAVEVAMLLAGGVECQTREDMVLDQQAAQGVGVIAFVGDQRAAICGAQIGDQRRSHRDIRHVARAQEQLERAPVSIDQGMDLRGQPSAADADGLGGLAAGRIQTTVVNADIAGINETQSSFGLFGQGLQKTSPQTHLTPPRKVSVNGAPRHFRAGQVTPRATRTQHIEQRRHARLQFAARSAFATPPFPVFTRLWYLYAGKASAPFRGVCD